MNLWRSKITVFIFGNIITLICVILTYCINDWNRYYPSYRISCMEIGKKWSNHCSNRLITMLMIPWNVDYYYTNYSFYLHFNFWFIYLNKCIHLLFLWDEAVILFCLASCSEAEGRKRSRQPGHVSTCQHLPDDNDHSAHMPPFWIDPPHWKLTNSQHSPKW